jgi:hypothetical protein
MNVRACVYHVLKRKETYIVVLFIRYYRRMKYIDCNIFLLLHVDTNNIFLVCANLLFSKKIAR